MKLLMIKNEHYDKRYEIKSEFGEERMTMKQALNWWDRTPEMAKQNLREHTFLGQETFNTIFQFYWGE